MPDGSPADGSATASDQPTTDLNHLWNRPAATPGRAGRELAGGERTGGERTGGERTGGERTGGERSGGWSYQGWTNPKAADGKRGSSSGEPTAEGSSGAGPSKPTTESGGSDEAVAGREHDLTDVGTEETTVAGDRAGFRLAAFGAVLVVVLFAGYGIGRLNNGTTSASAPPTAAAANGTATGGGATDGGATDGGATGGAMPGMVMDESQPHAHNNDGTVSQSGAATNSVGASVGGLSLSSGGLTLVPLRTTFVAGKRQRLAFRITGAGGAPVTSYAVVHDKLLHLVVIRRDLSGFQHLHPSMDAAGTWGIDLTLAQPGIYRMIADFTALIGGKPVATTLGSDLTVAGSYAPTALPAPAHAVATDGFAVGYEGTPSIQSTQPILVSVAGPDRRPAMLEPYLGAYGHLVVLRDGDLAYVHVHPEATLVDGKVKFWLSVPSSGVYRMFFDFQVAGMVHTAAWTMRVG